MYNISNSLQRQIVPRPLPFGLPAALQTASIPSPSTPLLPQVQCIHIVRVLYAWMHSVHVHVEGVCMHTVHVLYVCMDAQCIYMRKFVWCSQLFGSACKLWS